MMLSNNIELPFFPHYETEYLRGGDIRITWFEPKFSQSHYNVHNMTKSSNACTLIAVLMANQCRICNVIVNHPRENLNIRLIHKFAISMLEGNKIHEELKLNRLLKDINLNIPEALKYTRTDSTIHLAEWKSLIFMDRLSRNLYKNMWTNYIEWLKFDGNGDLYVMLIADLKTVMFLFQSKTNTITLFDSHQHTAERGAFIAITTSDCLAPLCFWFTEMVRKCYNADPKLYELSFLYFKCKCPEHH